MHFNNLDLNLLVALDALIEERNITRAGERLHLSQPAMSGALSRLRDYFGDPLLIQVGRKMVPTPLAETLYPRVHTILLQIQAAVGSRLTFDPAEAKRHFRVAVSDYVTSVLMTPLVAHLAQAAPGITLELMSLGDNPRENIERMLVDCLIYPQEYVSEQDRHLPLFEDDHVAVVWQGNDVVGDSLTLDQYQALGHVAVRFGNIGRSPSVDEKILAHKGILRREEIVTYDFNSALQLVVGTNRIATTHRRLAMLYARFTAIRILPLPIALPPLREVVVWHRYHDEDPAHRWLREVMVEIAGRA